MRPTKEKWTREFGRTKLQSEHYLKSSNWYALRIFSYWISCSLNLVSSLLPQSSETFISLYQWILFGSNSLSTYAHTCTQCIAHCTFGFEYTFSHIQSKVSGENIATRHTVQITLLLRIIVWSIVQKKTKKKYSTIQITKHKLSLLHSQTQSIQSFASYVNWNEHTGDDDESERRIWQKHSSSVESIFDSPLPLVYKYILNITRSTQLLAMLLPFTCIICVFARVCAFAKMPHRHFRRQNNL